MDSNFGSGVRDTGTGRGISGEHYVKQRATKRMCIGCDNSGGSESDH